MNKRSNDIYEGVLTSVFSDTDKRRILVFQNGKGTESKEIVADPSRFETVWIWTFLADAQYGGYLVSRGMHRKAGFRDLC